MPPASAGGTAARKADKTVPRDVPVTLRASGEKQVAAERLEWPPPKAPGRWSGGEVARTDAGGRPEWIAARPSGNGGRIATLACGERGQDHDVDERQRCWRHSDGGAQQEDAARHPEVGASEPTNRKGHWLGETEAAPGELLHTTQEGHWLGETEAAQGELLHATQERHWLGETEAAQGELLHTTQEGHWLGETEAAQGGLLHTTQEGHWLGETEAARGELLRTTQEGHWLGETEAAQGEMLHATQEGHWLGEIEAAQGGLLHAAPKPGEKAGQPRPRGESYEAPGEQRPQGGKHTGSPRNGGSDRSGARHQMGSATESLTDTTGCHLVPMYQVIGLSVMMALLILLLVSILRMALNIVIRVIAIARAKSCGWWLMGAFWGLLLQVAVAPVQWAVAKRCAISKAAAWRGSSEAVRLQAEDAKAQRPSSEDVDRSSALGTGPSIADGLESWRDELFSQENANQVYLVATIEGEQAAMGVTVAGRDTEDEKNGGGSTPAGTRLLIRSSPDRGSVLIHLDQHFVERGPYRSERERTLEIIDWGRIVHWLISPTRPKLITTARGHMPSTLPPSNRIQSARKQTKPA
jgi:hypothetical protein